MFENSIHYIGNQIHNYLNQPQKYLYTLHLMNMVEGPETVKQAIQIFDENAKNRVSLYSLAEKNGKEPWNFAPDSLPAYTQAAFKNKTLQQWKKELPDRFQKAGKQDQVLMLIAEMAAVSALIVRTLLCENFEPTSITNRLMQLLNKKEMRPLRQYLLHDLSMDSLFQVDGFSSDEADNKRTMCAVILAECYIQNQFDKQSPLDLSMLETLQVASEASLLRLMDEYCQHWISFTHPEALIKDPVLKFDLMKTFVKS